MTYISGLKVLIEIKKEYPELKMILHRSRFRFSSKSFNELLNYFYIIHSMSRAGTPTDNAAMESINEWIKTEIFTELHITSYKTIKSKIREYNSFFNEKRSAYSLNYLTPKQYK